jgi:hypothetical protein
MGINTRVKRICPLHGKRMFNNNLKIIKLLSAYVTHGKRFRQWKLKINGLGKKVKKKKFGTKEIWLLDDLEEQITCYSDYLATWRCGRKKKLVIWVIWPLDNLEEKIICYLGYLANWQFGRNNSLLLVLLGYLMNWNGDLMTWQWNGR